MKVEGWVFLGVGAFVVGVAVVYWFLSYEESGSVMLLLAGVLGLMVGSYLLVPARRPAPSDREARPDEVGRTGEPEQLYLPHASVWPFTIGVAALVVANGIALGLWALVPGGLLAAGGLLGWARQSRHRA